LEARQKATLGFTLSPQTHRGTYVCNSIYFPVLAWLSSHAKRSDTYACEPHGAQDVSPLRWAWWLLAVLPSPDVTGPPADAHTTAVGVAMRVLKTGQGIEKPQDNDCVQVHFTVWKRDGTMLSSSRLRGTAEVQCFRSIAPGVATALQAMVVGEERRIWVPRHLTLTPGAEDEAPPPVDVTLDIELIAIIKAPPTPTDLQPAPETVEKTTSGLAFRILQNGTGNQHPAPTSRVTLHLSGWTTKGDLFVSTVRSGRPAVYMVAHLIPGLREGVLHMVMGEKRRFWIPAALAYGEKSRRRGAPAGDLVYDVELLAAE
jgi:FKBP-type peptidyl-prolyl cis-trans isomerase